MTQPGGEVRSTTLSSKHDESHLLTSLVEWRAGLGQRRICPYSGVHNHTTDRHSTSGSAADNGQLTLTPHDGFESKEPLRRGRKEQGYFHYRVDHAGGGKPYVVLPFPSGRRRVSLRTDDQQLLALLELQINQLFREGASHSQIQQAVFNRTKKLWDHRQPVGEANKPTVGDFVAALRSYSRADYAAPLSAERLNVAISFVYFAAHYKLVDGKSDQFRAARGIDRDQAGRITLDRFVPADAHGVVAWAGDSAAARAGIRRHDSMRKGLLTTRAAMSADFISASGLQIPDAFVSFIHDAVVWPAAKIAIWRPRSYEHCWRPILQVCDELAKTPEFAALLAPSLIASLPLTAFAQATRDWFGYHDSALHRPLFGPLTLPSAQLRTLEAVVFSRATQHLLQHGAALRDTQGRLMERVRTVVGDAPEITHQPLAAISRFGRKALLSTPGYLDAGIAKALTHSGVLHLQDTFGDERLTDVAMAHRLSIIANMTVLYVS